MDTKGIMLRLTATGREVPLTGRRMTVGREPDNDLVIEDVKVSRYHAALKLDEDGRLSVTDFDSANGTYVGDRKLRGRSETLKDGDTLRFGDTTATVVQPAPVVADGATVLDVSAGTTRPLPTASRAEQSVVTRRPESASPRSGRPSWVRPVAGGAALVAAIVVILLIAGAFSSSSSKKPTQSASVLLTPQELIQLATPSVVRISGTTGGGSGFIIDAGHGEMATNAHVVAGRNNGLKAQIGNNTATEYPLQIVGQDPCDDLAVVQFANRPTVLRALRFGSSSALRPGDPVTVMGFPLSAQTGKGEGQASTVFSTSGTVSQVGVQVNADPHEQNYDPSKPSYQSMIVHQAPQQPGNSGGPLLAANGSVVGINTLSDPAAQGQYYSIASSYAAPILAKLAEGRNQGLIGWDLESPESEESLANAFSESELVPPRSADETVREQDIEQLVKATKTYLAQNQVSGMLDISDQSATPADKQGLQGFLITKIDNTPVSSVQEVCSIVSSAKPGDVLKLDVLNIAAGEDANRLAEVTGSTKPTKTEVVVPGE